MAKKVVEKEEAADEIVSKGNVSKIGQGRRVRGRFWLQVDRQTKSTFESSEEAEQAGDIIKKAHPIVQVSVYDAVETTQKILE